MAAGGARVWKALALLAVAGLAACARQAPLLYQPTGVVQAVALPAVGQVSVTDTRGESDPTWIGAVRGGFGNPLKVLHTPQPLADIVGAAFRNALAARGLLASNGGGQADMAVTVSTFDGTKYVRREANVTMGLVLRERATGRVLFSDAAKANLLEGSVLALDNGVFGSSDELFALEQKAMNQVIDKLLDSPGLIAALRSAAAPGT